MKIIILKAGKENKVLNFYQWIFKDDLQSVEGNPQPGEIVRILSQNGKFIGLGFFNPSAQIPVRVFSLSEENPTKIIEQKLLRAFQKRNNIKMGRLVFSEADFLPGLIIDRYGDYFVVQIRNPGMYAFINPISILLRKIFSPRGVILRNDFETLRDGEIPRGIQVIDGTKPEKPVLIKENGLQFYVDVVGGQKTGYFFDQKANRLKVKEKVKQGDLGLDLYSYTGGFALMAASSGANVIAVDKSKEDLELAQKNAELNNLQNSITFVQDDVENFLSHWKKKVDFIVCDPPGMAKKRSELKRIQYTLVNILIRSFGLLKENGWMVCFSCSYLMDWNFMMNSIRIAASKLRVPLFLEEISLQNADHPILLQMPETLYLKGFWLRKGELL